MSTTANAATPAPAARQPIRVGLLGYGEVGHGLATGLVAEGLATVSAYQRASDRPTIQARARASGVELLPTADALAEQSDLIIAATQVAETLAAARAIAPSIEARHCYVDLASASPNVKREVGEVIAARGALVVDGVLEGSPLEYVHRIPILASGPGAKRFEEAMGPWGMRIRVIGDELGKAAAIKCLRHIVTKGLIAILIESLTAARRYGVADELFQTLSEWHEALPWSQHAQRIVRTTAVHASRRADEVAMSAGILREIGMDPIMAEATETLLRRVGDIGLRDSLATEVPKTLQEALALIERYGLKEKKQ